MNGEETAAMGIEVMLIPIPVLKIAFCPINILQTVEAAGSREIKGAAMEVMLIPHSIPHDCFLSDQHSADRSSGSSSSSSAV